ncbi:MAG: anhydro-N-acetylmuramic acid kinase [Pirellulales bacterium]|nr:anhydro-N-acetylmuramic acid kinase [Pirellulales bacterium]
MRDRIRSNPTGPIRSVAGIAVSSDIRRIAAVCLRIHGRGLDARAEMVGNAIRGLPLAAAGQFRAIVEGHGSSPGPLASLAAELAEIQAQLIGESCGSAVEKDDSLPYPLVVGTHEPGLWHCIDNRPHAQIGLCDAARLAERTGLNVMDAFPARDLAHGGVGGPIEPIAQWLLLHDAKRNRILLDLGRTSRMTYLPAGCEGSAAGHVMATDVGPGMALLDDLTSRLTGGRQQFDPGGSLAVQGRCNPDLLDHLLSAPYFDHPGPKWHPAGTPTNWFLSETLHWGSQHGNGLRDLLCTVTHLIAVAIVRCLHQYVPHTPSPIQLILTGGGERNGLLLRELTRRLNAMDMIPISELGMHRDQLDAACVAILALLSIDHVPQTRTHTTGIEAPRILGRLTPGSPQNWYALLQMMAASTPATMSLRCAI